VVGCCDSHDETVVLRMKMNPGIGLLDTTYEESVAGA
jgi:hypothetical protein